MLTIYCCILYGSRDIDQNIKDYIYIQDVMFGVVDSRVKSAPNCLLSFYDKGSPFWIVYPNPTFKT